MRGQRAMAGYCLLGLAVGDGVAAICCGKFLFMSSTLSGVMFEAVTRIFQSSPSRTQISNQ
jgi:hypothetical protein